MVTKMPRLFGAMYKVGGWVSSRYIKSPCISQMCLTSDNLRRFISENGFDTVVMPHLFPAGDDGDTQKKAVCARW